MPTSPLAALRHHVSGAIARGEAVAITEQRAPATTPRPLAKALHTVTVVARVAQYEANGPISAQDAPRYALHALAILGYTADQIDTTGPLFAACVKAVRA